MPHTAAKCPIWRAAESVCAQAGLTLVVLSGTEAIPEMQVVAAGRPGYAGPSAVRGEAKAAVRSSCHVLTGMCEMCDV